MFFKSSKQGKIVREDFLEEVILERLEDCMEAEKLKNVSREEKSMNKGQKAG